MTRDINIYANVLNSFDNNKAQKVSPIIIKITINESELHPILISNEGDMT